MGAGGASTGGGRGGVGPAGRKTSGAYGTAKDARRTSRRNEGRSAVKKAAEFIATGGITGAVIRSLSNNTGSTKTSPTIDYSEKGRESGGGQTIIKKTAGGQTIQTTAPTQAEVSQSAAADAEAYDLRKTKKRGRSMTILSSSKGTRPTDKLTLGKPSLLGQ